jgi:uncharacterized membrane protein (UPF0127 family)
VRSGTLALLLSILLLLAGCGGEEVPASAGEEGPTVVIDTGGDEVEVQVELADSAQERAVGLMNRASLDDDAGMLFLFPEAASGGFWMKNTLIPLSIAFADGEGRILRVLDMQPCRADPCEVYEPGVSYRSALEVNQGAFAEWGVEEGDRLRLEP